MTDRHSDRIDDPSAGPSDTGVPEATADVPDLEAARIEAIRLIGHRARTPLSLVIGPIASVIADDEIAGDIRFQLATAAEQAARLRADLDLLIEVGRWPGRLDRRPVRLGELVTAAARECYGSSSWRGFSYDVTTSDGAEILLDEERARWALDVLLTDVASRAGEHARHLVTCDDDPSGDAVLVAITVEDGDAADGADVRSRAVEVALARRIIALHGGSVTDTSDGDVDLLTVRLPLPDSQSSVPTSIPTLHGERLSPSASRPTAVSSDDREAGGRPPAFEAGGEEGHVVGPVGRPLVLVVEDDRVLRGYLTRVLSTEYRVVHHATAERARTAIEQLRPDAIVCDLALPDERGDELISSLHADPDLAEIPVVVITGYDDAELRVDLLRDGADDYITKPFTVDELAARIDNLISVRLDVADLQTRADHAQRVADQLQQALESRVVIEQAKAFIATDRGIDVDAAFEVLRRYARSNSTNIHEVARRVVDGFRP